MKLSPEDLTLLNQLVTRGDYGFVEFTHTQQLELIRLARLGLELEEAKEASDTSSLARNTKAWARRGYLHKLGLWAEKHLEVIALILEENKVFAEAGDLEAAKALEALPKKT